MKKSDTIIQFISSENKEMTHLQSIEKALNAGVRWIQLRIKDKPEEEMIALAKKALDLCEKYEATLIINDFPKIVTKVGAHGVHLGKKDMKITEAREIVGSGKIIGGTANTFEDIVVLAKLGVDYIGLGPFKFTKTKKELSPLLGEKGYCEIIDRCNKEKITIPIIAIGGIQKEDIETVFDTGVDGIAVSSGLINNENPERFLQYAVDYKKNKKFKTTVLC